MSHIAYVGFGSNLGDREAKFRESLAAMAGLPETSMKTYSKLYETRPVGLKDGGSNFLNAAIALETDLTPQNLISELRRIELRLGKPAGHRSDMSRAIDLDLLLYDDLQIRNPDFEIPHPRMDRRAFVLIPLAEIAAEAIHPVFGRSVAVLLTLLPQDDLEGVRPWETSFGHAAGRGSQISFSQ